MKLIFTEYLRSLAEKSEPAEEAFDAVLSELAVLLRRKMRQRFLWNAPTSYLGVRGWSSWSQKEAFRELLYDCYIFNFVDRLSPLQGFLKCQPNIEGMVRRNISNFLFERQRKQDPVGYRTFQMLRSAVRESTDANELYVLVGDSRLSNATVLGFSPDAEGSPEPQEKALAESMRAWSHDLLPGLVIASGKEKAKVVGKLRRHLLDLEDEGFESFEFKDLINPLKWTVREWWRALALSSQGELGFEDDDEEGGKLVQLVAPDSTLEEAQVLEQLSACVEDAIDVWGNRVKTRSDLRKLLLFLKALAAEDALRPSNRTIGEVLEIPRTSVPKLFSILGQLVENCRMGEG